MDQVFLNSMYNLLTIYERFTSQMPRLYPSFLPCEPERSSVAFGVHGEAVTLLGHVRDHILGNLNQAIADGLHLNGIKKLSQSSDKRTEKGFRRSSQI